MKQGSHTPNVLRRISCAVFALLLAMSIPMNVLAAEYTVGTSEELSNSWSDASNNEDASNSFVITNDIDMMGYTLAAAEGKTYTVSSEEGEDNALSHVCIHAPSNNEGGDVTIKTDVTGEDYYALTVSGNVDVSVVGDVTQTSETTENGSWVAVGASNGASLTITGDVTMAEAGISAQDATVNVNGDVTLTSEGDDSNNNFVIDADMGGSVLVIGDVTTEEIGVLAMRDSTVSIIGDLTQESSGEADSWSVISASDGGAVTVFGDVSSDEGGILTNDAKVTVTGDVTVDTGIEDPAFFQPEAISANNESSISIGGDVISSGNAVDANLSSTVTVNGDVTSEDRGVSASGGSSVTVKGDIYSESIAATAYEESTVKVGGDIVSDSAGLRASGSTIDVTGDVISTNTAVNVSDSTVTIGGDVISTGVECSALGADGSTVTIQGDVSSPDSCYLFDSDVKIYGDFDLNSYDSDAVVGELVLAEGSSLYMGDKTLLEANAVHILHDSTVDAAMLKAESVSVGVSESNGTDESKLYAYTNTANTGIDRLTTAGKSETILRGDVGDVYASENSYVEVWRDAESITRTDKARVVVNLADKEDQEYYLPEHDADDYAVGNTTAHTIVDLCQSYTVNSTLYNQCSEMQSLLANVSADISDELNIGSAAWASLFDHETINTSSYLSNRFTDTGASSIYQNENYNEASQANFKKCDNINTYLIDKFKDNLAQSMVDLSSSEAEWKEQGYAENEALMKIFTFTKKIDDASGVVLSAEETEFLKNVTDSNGNISGPDMLEFLRRFGYYTEGDTGAVLAAQRMSDAYEQIGPYMEDAALLAKLAKAGLTIYDFAKYYMADYTNQMIVLDKILAEQELSAEMFAAAAELRATMEDKRLGTVEKAVDLIKTESVGVIKDLLYAPLAVGQAVLDLAGLITGGTKDSEDLQNGAALTILAPQLLTTFENSIKNVRDGDTSDEAIQMVYMSYTMVKTTLSNMCDIMTNIGNTEQENEYKAILAKLDAMDLGEIVALTE